MQIQGSPFRLSAATADMPELSERFWYWQGASGRKYIHSVYEPENCPPLPGAVYVGVKRQGSMRIAVCVGRFLPLWDAHKAINAKFSGFDELHVHLLASASGEAEQVRADLSLALGEVADFELDPGFRETAQSVARHYA